MRVTELPLATLRSATVHETSSERAPTASEPAARARARTADFRSQLDHFRAELQHTGPVTAFQASFRAHLYAPELPRALDGSTQASHGELLRFVRSSWPAGGKARIRRLEVTAQQEIPVPGSAPGERFVLAHLRISRAPARLRDRLALAAYKALHAGRGLPRDFGLSQETVVAPLHISANGNVSNAFDDGRLTSALRPLGVQVEKNLWAGTQDRVVNLSLPPASAQRRTSS